MIQGLRINTKE